MVKLIKFFYHFLKNHLIGYTRLILIWSAINVMLIIAAFMVDNNIINYILLISGAFTLIVALISAIFLHFIIKANT